MAQATKSTMPTSVNCCNLAELQAAGLPKELACQLLQERDAAPFETWPDVLERVSGVKNFKKVLQDAGFYVGTRNLNCTLSDKLDKLLRDKLAPDKLERLKIAINELQRNASEEGTNDDKDMGDFENWEDLQARTGLEGPDLQELCTAGFYVRPPIATNLNNCSALRIAAVPGLGDEGAHRIVLERETAGPFQSWDDVLSRMKGEHIGEKKVYALKIHRFYVDRLSAPVSCLGIGMTCEGAADPVTSTAPADISAFIVASLAQLSLTDHSILKTFPESDTCPCGTDETVPHTTEYDNCTPTPSDVLAVTTSATTGTHSQQTVEALSSENARPKDINASTLECIAAVPGLGDKVASRMIDERNSAAGSFKDWDDVCSRVKGMGVAKVKLLQSAGFVVGDVFQSSECPPQPSVRSTDNGTASTGSHAAHIEQATSCTPPDNTASQSGPHSAMADATAQDGVCSITTAQLKVASVATTVGSIAVTQLAVERIATTRLAVGSIATTQLSVAGSFETAQLALGSVATTQVTAVSIVGVNESTATPGSPCVACVNVSVGATAAVTAEEGSLLATGLSAIAQPAGGTAADPTLPAAAELWWLKGCSSSQPFPGEFNQAAATEKGVWEYQFDHIGATQQGFQYRGRSMSAEEVHALRHSWEERYPCMPSANTHGNGRESAAERVAATSSITTKGKRFRQRAWSALADQEGSETIRKELGAEWWNRFRCDPFGNVVSIDAAGGPVSAVCAFELDHIFPWSRGGLSVDANFMALHWQANRYVKNDKVLDGLSELERAQLSRGIQVDVFIELVKHRTTFLRHKRRTYDKHLVQLLTSCYTLPKQPSIATLLTAETLLSVLNSHYAAAMADLMGTYVAGLEPT